MAENKSRCALSDDAPTSIQASPTDSALTQLKKKWSVYTHGDLKRLSAELGNERYLVEGLLPDRSLGLLIGDSGLGKSALIYQLALCVAAGIPFLGRAVRQGSVLCLDFENGLGQVDEMLDAFMQHLGLDAVPSNLLLWNVNDCPSNFGTTGHTSLDLIREVKPSLVIVDALTDLDADIEAKNPNATKTFQQLRTVMKDCGTSILSSHHIRKPSDNPPPPSLEDGNVRQWFLQARGARALINGSDVRLGVDVPQSANLLRLGSEREEIALVMRGFGRVRGEIPLTYLARVRDEHGEPLGYRIVGGARLLFNQDQEDAFRRLPQSFRFKEAQQVYGRGAQATTDFLSKCNGVGILRKSGRVYEKAKVAE